MARLNSDRVFFGKTNARFVNFKYAGNGDVQAFLDPATGAQLDQTVEVVPPDRDYAIELGVESLIDGDWGAATLRAFHDVSGTHGGYELSAYYSRRWTRGSAVTRADRGLFLQERADQRLLLGRARR